MNSFLAFKLSDVVFIMLVNATIRVEHESFKVSRPVCDVSVCDKLENLLTCSFQSAMVRVCAMMK